jgi:hypothetical protein
MSVAHVPHAHCQQASEELRMVGRHGPSARSFSSEHILQTYAHQAAARAGRGNATVASDVGGDPLGEL